MPSATDIEHWLRHLPPGVEEAGCSSSVAEAYCRVAGLDLVVAARIEAKQECWVEGQPARQAVQLALNQVAESRAAGHYRMDYWKEQHLGMHPEVEGYEVENSTCWYLALVAA